MNRCATLFIISLSLSWGCTRARAPESQEGATVGVRAPVGEEAGQVGQPRLEEAPSLAYKASGPFPINLSEIPPGIYDPHNQLDRGRWAGRMESPISDLAADRLRKQALLLPSTELVQNLSATGLEPLAPALGASFDSLDFNDCCGGGGVVPPDPELAVGPNHVIAVVNLAFEIYDKSGTLLQGPTTFSSFFAGTPGCSNTGVFDPNVLYDEEHDRFILGIDGDGTDYCVAATTGSDPTSSWNRYGFATNVGGAFFDYPHAGVGVDAIYMGANLFTGPFFAGARVWAMDKFELYNGMPLSIVTRSTGGDDSPQPANLHGFLQGTWPVAGPHYFVTSRNFNGSTFEVYSWDDPFGANILVDVGTVNLPSFHGVAVGFPVDVPQAGSGELQANDWRPMGTEYRNGTIWFGAAVSCNPGGGTVDCVQWAHIDPTGPAILDAGVFATSGEYRIFPDLAANDCNDMAVGYTKSSSGIFPAVWVTGRESGDPAGTLQGEIQLKAGDITYTAFDGTPYRWGDYTGMTIDPDGQTFWYLGEYGKDTGTTVGRWGTYIGSFQYSSCGESGPPGQATGPGPADGATAVDVDADLSWTSGFRADSHDVYFGTNPAPGGGELVGNQTGTSFDPGTLAHGTTHYWRIDEVNGLGTTAGAVWSFTTAEETPPDEVTILEAKYRADRDELKIKARSSEQPGAVLTVVGYGVMPFKKDRYELKLRPLAPLPVPSTVTVESSLGGSATSAVVGAPQPTLPGPASNPNPANSAAGVSINAVLSWTAGSGADSHDVYFGTTSPGAFQGNQTGTSFDPGILNHSTAYYWRIDEVNGEGTTTGLVWSFTTESEPGPPGQASNPNPANSAAGVSVNPVLSWTAGSGADSHDVYFGTSSPGAFRGNQTGTSFDPGVLNNNTTYYWRIDEVNGLGTNTGVVWSFTTAPESGGDVVTITKAEWRQSKQELRVTATSSEQPNAVLTVAGFGQMAFKRNKYELKIKPVPNPVTVTVTSSLGGSDTATVVTR